MRKEVIILITCILALSLFSAVHSATVNFSTISLMETTASDANLTINNYGSQDPITKVELALNGFTLNSVTNYTDWIETQTNTSAMWENGTIATNVLLALFEMNIAAPQVTSNTTAQLSVITTDSQGSTQTHLFNITIINDDSAPLLSEEDPQNNAYFKEGISYLVGVNATDPETGIDYVSFTHQRCSGNTSSQISLLGGPRFTQTVDFSGYVNGDQVCFTYLAANNGGEEITLNGSLFIDGIAPNVTLDAPAEGAIVNAQQQFLFTATDNLAPTLTCAVLIDNTQTITLNVTSGVQAAISAQNVTEGAHTWTVRCEDLAGHTTAAPAQNYFLDKTPPNVTINPQNASIIAPSTQITLLTTDNYEVNYTQFAYANTTINTTGNHTINASIFTDGPHTITAYTQDAVGNNATFVFTLIVDSTAPVITSIGPNTSDVSVNFTINVSDTWDSTLECTVSISDGSTVSGKLTSGVEGILQHTLPVGVYNYTVTCSDDAQNSITSPQQTLTIIDTSGPTITFNQDTQIVRGEDLLLNATITDISGISNVLANVTYPDGSVELLNLMGAGDEYTASITTDANTPEGDYVFTIYAEDPFANTNTASSTVQVTYDVIITLSANPATITLGESTTLRGTVTYDNGTNYPSGIVEITTPEGTDTLTLTNASYSFVYTPLTTGTKSVSASFTALNNITAQENTAVIVNGVSSSGGDDKSSSGGRSKGGCNQKWTCDSWSVCSGGTQQRTCTNVCDNGGSRVETRSCSVEEEQLQVTPSSSARQNNIITICIRPGTDQQKELNIPVREWKAYASKGAKQGECPDISPSEDASSAIGEAAGFLQALNLDATRFLGIVLITLALLLGLFLYTRKSSDDDFWEDYFEKRR